MNRPPFQLIETVALVNILRLLDNDPRHLRASRLNARAKLVRNINTILVTRATFAAHHVGLAAIHAR